MSSPKNKSNCKILAPQKHWKVSKFDFSFGWLIQPRAPRVPMSRMVIHEGDTVLYPSCNEQVPNLTDMFHLFDSI